MTRRSWLARIGPLTLAAALVPALVGALVLAAPRPVAVDIGSAAGGVLAATPSQQPPFSVADAKATTPPADEAPMIPCSTLRPHQRGPVAAPPIAVEGMLSAIGELTGRRLTVRARRGVGVSVTLPSDSFVATPSGDWLVYGSAGRKRSEIRAIDLETGCDVRLAQVAGVARSAALAASGAELYVHTLDTASRRDLGVARIDLETGVQATVVPPFEAGGDFGAVYATSLGWSLDAVTLAIQSCGASACHTRLFDTGTGLLRNFTADHGPIIGVTAAELIVYALGHERPTAIVAIDLASGAERVLAADAYEAELDGSAAAPRLRIDTAAGWQEVVP